MPISGGRYVNPNWVNNANPAVNSDELNDMSDTLELVPAALLTVTTVSGANLTISSGTTVLYPTVTSGNSITIAIPFAGTWAVAGIANGVSLGETTVVVTNGNSYAVQLGGDVFQIGDIKESVRTDLGPDWLLCNGAAVSPYDYPALSAVLPNNTSTASIQTDTSAAFSFTSAVTKFKYVGDYWFAIAGNTLYYAQDPFDAWSSVDFSSINSYFDHIVDVDQHWYDSNTLVYIVLGNIPSTSSSALYYISEPASSGWTAVVSTKLRSATAMARTQNELWVTKSTNTVNLAEVSYLSLGNNGIVNRTAGSAGLTHIASNGTTVGVTNGTKVWWYQEGGTNGSNDPTAPTSGTGYTIDNILYGNSTWLVDWSTNSSNTYGYYISTVSNITSGTWTNSTVGVTTASQNSVTFYGCYDGLWSVLKRTYSDGSYGYGLYLLDSSFAEAKTWGGFGSAPSGPRNYALTMGCDGSRNVFISTYVSSGTPTQYGIQYLSGAKLPNISLTGAYAYIRAQ